ENKSDYQEIVRISDAQNCKSVLISPAWRTPGTGFRPQILVKRLVFYLNSEYFCPVNTNSRIFPERSGNSLLSSVCSIDSS
ncbi:hypothetical protein, partial [Victivallis lenta]|uniref:hypothetical protein n=1 Tax=Victivallis lenta TaxID=2606640 RepID=UPI0019802BF8